MQPWMPEWISAPALVPNPILSSSAGLPAPNVFAWKTVSAGFHFSWAFYLAFPSAFPGCQYVRAPPSIVSSNFSVTVFCMMFYVIFSSLLWKISSIQKVEGKTNKQKNPEGMGVWLKQECLPSKCELNPSSAKNKNKKPYSTHFFSYAESRLKRKKWHECKRGNTWGRGSSGRGWWVSEFDQSTLDACRKPMKILFQAGCHGTCLYNSKYWGGGHWEDCGFSQAWVKGYKDPHINKEAKHSGTHL
jgi:hypothetical protein